MTTRDSFRHEKIDGTTNDGSSEDALEIESQVLYSELRNYGLGREVPDAVNELLGYQANKRRVDTSISAQLPVPMLGYRGQKIDVLVISICQEFKSERVVHIPETVDAYINGFRYSESIKKNGNNEDKVPYGVLFKKISYFRKIDWILGKIWESNDYLLGKRAIYADIIPWATPYKWRNFKRDVFFQEYGSVRMKRLLEILRPTSVVSLGAQASEFVGSWDTKIAEKNHVKPRLSQEPVSLVSIYRPVSSNEGDSYTQQVAGMSDWEAKFLAHLDKIQEYLGII